MTQGACMMLASAFLFAVMGVGVKFAAAEIPSQVIVFFRSAAGVILLTPWILLPRSGGLRTTHIRQHLLRGIIGLGAMYCFFFALARMRLADAFLLSYTSPLFIPFIAKFWLKEEIPAWLWGVLGLGFVGVVLILKPGSGIFDPAALIALSAGLLGAFAQVGVRGLTKTEPAGRIVFYFSLISAAAAAVPLPGLWAPPSFWMWMILIVLGTIATVAQVCLTKAYKSAPAAQVGPFIYTAVVFASVFDWWFWRVVPDLMTVIGAVLVFTAGALTARCMGRPIAETPIVEDKE